MSASIYIVFFKNKRKGILVSVSDEVPSRNLWIGTQESRSRVDAEHVHRWDGSVVHTKSTNARGRVNSQQHKPTSKNTRSSSFQLVATRGRLSPNYGGNQIKQQQQNKPEIAGRVPVPVRPHTARRMFLSPPLCFALLSQVRAAATATGFLLRFQARRRPSSHIDRSVPASCRRGPGRCARDFSLYHSL